MDLYKLFSYTVFYSNTPEKMHDSLRLILNSSLYLFKTLFIISFFLNSFLCIDLYLTVKSPFTPASSRCKVYYFVSFVTGIIVSWIEASRFNTKGSSEAEEATVEEITILISFAIFIIIAVPATIFASRRILRKGVSESVRREVISRHIKYILILTLSFVLYAWKIFEEDVLDKSEAGWLDQLSVYAFASQGLLLSILRVSEPLVWQTFKEMFKDIFCCRGKEAREREKEEKGKIKEGLNTFLASSFNVELVYIILKGIQKFAKELKAIENGKSRL